MTEAEWLASENPSVMLGALLPDRPTLHPHGGRGHLPLPRPSGRKLRLFACACWRVCLARRRRPDSVFAKVISLAERVADGGAAPPDNYDFSVLADDAGNAARSAATNAWVGRDGGSVSGAEMAAFLRDIVGNPFRPVTLPASPVPCLECGGSGREAVPDPPGVVTSFRGKTRPCPYCKGGRVPGPCLWLTPTVRCLALATYLERDRPCPACRAPGGCGVCRGSGRITDGMLDPVRLAVLADALEEAGCEDGSVLDHLRGPGPHCRGCWVVDMLLGKA